MDPKTNSSFSLKHFLENSRLGAFFLCVIIAAGIWTINALNKTQRTVVQVELRYNEAWLRAWSAGNQPDHLEMELSGRGFDLADFILRHHHPVVEIKEQGLFNADNHLKARELVQPFLKSFAGKLNVEHITPDLIELPSRKSYFKRVAILPTFDLKLKNTYMISGPAVCVPDSLWLSGASPFPDSLTTVYTNTVQHESIHGTVFESVNLNLKGLKNVIPEITSAWIYIPVEQSTECTVSVPLTPETKKGNVQLIPAEIQVTCRVPMSKFDATTPASFEFLATITQQNQKKAIVKLKSAPWWADRITWKPATADFLFY
ncbi:YbbR-like domain-containing protein [soil metagenome]